MIKRDIESHIIRRLGDNKVIVVLGARQTGKTTLLKSMFAGTDTLYLNADEADVRAMFSDVNATLLRERFAGYSKLVIDEAQRIEDIGIKLKLVVDNIDGLKTIVSGSSALDIANKVKEPLTGRKWEFQLHPLSLSELVEHKGEIEERRLLQQRLVFGCYPDVVINPGDEREILRELSDSYLFKDILMWENIKQPKLLVDLLKHLSLQVGSDVSYNSLANKLGVASKTVENYIDLLEKTFVIFRLHSFSRNHAKELRKSKKIYFFDNGIMNAVTANYAPVSNRDDVGRLWENYIVSETLKNISNRRDHGKMYFWRTKDKQEIDIIIEKDGKLEAIECKWNPKASASPPGGFSSAYPEATFRSVNRENYISEILSSPSHP